MKRTITLILLLSMVLGVSAQKKSHTQANIMFFKADLSCCMKKQCDELFINLDAIIKEIYPNGNVTLQEIKLNDTQNKEIVNKYKAINETVIVVITRRKKVTEVNITQLVADFKKNNDKEKFKQELVAVINKK